METKPIFKHKRTKLSSLISSVVQNNLAETLQNSEGKAIQNKIKRASENVSSSNILNRESIPNEDRKSSSLKKNRNNKIQGKDESLPANNSQNHKEKKSLFKNEKVDGMIDNTKRGTIVCDSSKTILRPSKLGTVTDSSSAVFGNFSASEKSVTDRKSKRQWKPSLKMQQHSSAQRGHSLGSISKTGAAKFGQATFGSPLNSSTTVGDDKSSKSNDTNKQDSPGDSDIQNRNVATSKDAAESDRKSKRQWKPSLKMQQHVNSSAQRGNSLGSISKTGASTIIEHGIDGNNEEDNHIDIENEDSCDTEKLKELPPSKSQKKPLIRQTKFRNRNHELISNKLSTESRTHSHKSSPLIRESRLKLNQEVLEQLRVPSQQVKFYQAIQRSMQNADRKPPRLIGNQQNPAGTALISYNEDAEDNISKPATQIRSPKYSGGGTLKPSNRMPGHIVCGICGAVRYYSFILQAKKFGTFSCEPCRKFISKCIRMSKDASNDEELFNCVNSSTETTLDAGMCVVPPVIRKTPSTPLGANRKSDNIDSPATVRCQACWLKLCLIGYNLEPILYDKLRLHLSPKDTFIKMLPISSERQKSAALLPHRGKILEFNRQVTLSRPLFDGFGISDDTLEKQNSQLSDISSSITDPNVNQNKHMKNKNIEGDVGSKISTSLKSSNTFTTNAMSPKSRKITGLKHLPNCCVERLPNGWTKKALKHVSGKKNVISSLNLCHTIGKLLSP